jgi:hypothetical protein
MLQIDHIYNFFQKSIFKNIFSIWYPNNGITPPNKNPKTNDFVVFTDEKHFYKILFIDQEPLSELISANYIECFSFPSSNISLEEVYLRVLDCPYGHEQWSYEVYSENLKNPAYVYKEPKTLVVSEKSSTVEELSKQFQLKILYYFFHGFAALDWYRGFYALNYNKSVVKIYKYDYVTFNRIVSSDRSYRCYFVTKLIEKKLLSHGQVSFGLDSSGPTWKEEMIDVYSKLSLAARKSCLQHLSSIEPPLIIDGENIDGSASSDIPKNIDYSFWHVVTETVFYYDKLHLTEKIFKPIVSKQPFMLLAAPGNLAYLKSYGFKTFDCVIDESYDDIQDPDQRIDAVVDQLNWYCNLTDAEKLGVAEKLEPIIEYNFHHFYGEFRHIITRELLDNCQTLFKEIGYDDGDIAYDDIYRVLTA